MTQYMSLEHAHGATGSNSRAVDDDEALPRNSHPPLLVVFQRLRFQRAEGRIRGIRKAHEVAVYYKETRERHCGRGSRTLERQRLSRQRASLRKLLVRTQPPLSLRRHLPAVRSRTVVQRRPYSRQAYLTNSMPRNRNKKATEAAIASRARCAFRMFVLADSTCATSYRSRNVSRRCDRSASLSCTQTMQRRSTIIAPPQRQSAQSPARHAPFQTNRDVLKKGSRERERERVRE